MTLKKAVHARKPSNVAELQQFCQDEWAKIPPQRCNRLIVSGFCCVSSVPASCVHIGLFPVLVSCHYKLICVQLCVCDCVNYPVYIVPVF